MTIVKVGTAKLTKAEAIQEAFERYFTDVQVIVNDVPSGVPRQPVDEEVFQGAKNRIEELRKGEKYDYIVACEGGLMYQYGHWFNVQVVMVEAKDGKNGLGLSQGFEVPSKYIEEIRTTSISKVLDRIFDGKGGVRMLTQSDITRKDLIKDGTIMALTRIINGDIW